MKTFNFKSLLNLSLMAGLLVSTVLVSSCKSDDDDDSDPIFPSGKKLQFVKNGSSTTRFEFDNNTNRVLSVTENGSKTLFSYTDNQITVTTTANGQNSVTTYMLTNGRITKSIIKSNNSESDLITNFAYDGNGCLTSANFTYTTTQTYEDTNYRKETTKKTTDYRENFTWKDGNLVSKTSNQTVTEESTTIYYDYNYNTNTKTVRSTDTSSEVTSTNTDVIYTHSDRVYRRPATKADEVLEWQGFFGTNNARLFSKAQITSTETTNTKYNNKETKGDPEVSSATVDYSYNFNGDLLQKIFETTTIDNHVNVNEIEFSWE